MMCDNRKHELKNKEKSMKNSVVVRFEAGAVEEALSKLGVPMNVLQEAVQAGYLSRITRTTNDARNAAGFYQWNETVRSLRDNMVVYNWQCSDEGNLPIIIHPEKKIAIAVSSGDQNTGKIDAMPCSKSSKGPRTAAAVKCNAEQLMLPGFEPLQLQGVVDMESKYPTWLLLFYTDMDKLRAELSFPVSMDCDGHISGWHERIILPEFPIDPNYLVVEPDFGPDIDIKIARKG